MNLFICGSRKITNKKWIFSQIEACIAEHNFTDITILEGEAKGVDTIAKEWAVSHSIPVREYPPDYNPENASFDERCNAFYKRNEEMAIDCDFMLVLWTGESSGSFHDILMAEKHHKLYKVCLYDTNKNDATFRTAVIYALEKHKELFSSSLNPRAIFSKFKIFVNQALRERSKSFGYELEPWWEEGHYSGSCFWVMPVRQGKDQNDGSWGCHCCWKEEISIEEDIVYEYLYVPFLRKYFDTSIEYTCREKEYGAETIEFDWWGYNLYTYDAVKKMADEMIRYADQQMNTVTAEFYRSLGKRLILMMERQPDWDFITFEGS